MEWNYTQCIWYGILLNTGIKCVLWGYSTKEFKTDGKWFSFSFSWRASSASAQWENTYGWETNTHAGKTLNLISGKFCVRRITCFRICLQIDKCMSVFVYSLLSTDWHENTMTWMSFRILHHYTQCIVISTWCWMT